MKKIFIFLGLMFVMLSGTYAQKDRQAIGFGLSYGTVLSKILCKWKQDSVVSLFLYLDSVFKYKHKLVHNQSPV